jgi:DNA invertase Pin-like site-specific DNA recombinase
MRKATQAQPSTVAPSVRAAIYARVSTVDQDCALQLRELREFCVRRGWQNAGEYVDTGWSGAKAHRPELDRAMKDASEHRWDAILVWKLDRFGRSVLNLSEQLAQLNSWGIRFIATSQGLDTDANNPTSRLLLHILAAVAEFEREMIRERVRAGMAAAKHAGVKVGRPRLTLDHRRARKLAKTGKSHRYIAELLGIGKGTVGRLLAKAAMVLIAVGFSVLMRVPKG